MRCHEWLLTEIVSVRHWTRQLEDLALFWHFPGLYSHQLHDGLSAGLCAIRDEAILAVEVMVETTLFVLCIGGLDHKMHPVQSTNDAK